MSSAARRQLDGTGLKRLHRSWRRRTAGRVSLILEAVSVPANVGSIVRSAAAFRVDQLWLCAGATEPVAAGAAKVALGTDRYLSWQAVATVDDAVAAARAAGYEIVGLELTEDAVPLHELAPAPARSLVVGHEDRGLSRRALELCDRVAYLPLLGKVGSLNVATATAVALYELRRQEWQRS